MSSSVFPYFPCLLPLLIFHVFCMCGLICGEVCTTYIVHMDPISMPRVFSQPSAWHSAILRTIKLRNSENYHSLSNGPTFVYSYSAAISGFSAVLCPYDLKLLEKTWGFIAATKSRPITLYTTRSPNFLGLNSLHGLWPASNFGEDIIIGVVDTGIWPESSSFSDVGMPEIPAHWKGACENGTDFNGSICNRKIIGARYFSKGIIAEDPHANITMNSPRDVHGHGTHCASISAGSYVDGAGYAGYGSGVARGIAPRARLAMYKVLFNNGSDEYDIEPVGTSADMLAGIDQAIVDGVDILSLSIGGDDALYEIASGTFSAMEKGIFVSMAAGNGGPYEGSILNDFPWVLTVGAGTIDREFRGTIALSNGVTVSGLSVYTGEAICKEVDIIDMKLCQNGEEMLKVHHMIVVCRTAENSSSIEDLFDLVQMAEGVRGAVFVSNYFDLDEFFERRINYPALFVTPEEGKTVIDYANSAFKPKGQMLFGETNTGSKPAPRVASFSARGPSKDFKSLLKPDIIAPGVLVLASWSPKHWIGDFHSKEVYGAFKFNSGTSMAAPHVAGIGALLRAAHPEWSPAAIKSAILTTADVLDNTHQPIKDAAWGDQPANPLAMGCGHLNPDRALDPGLVYNATAQDYINLLCSMNLTRAQIFSIVRSSQFSCANATWDLNYASFFTQYKSDSKGKLVREFKRTVTNVGSGETEYKAVVRAPQDCNVTVSPTVLKFCKRNEEQSFRLTIQCGGEKKETTALGHLIWVEVDGNHTVMSPVVVSPVIKGGTGLI